MAVAVWFASPKSAWKRLGFDRRRRVFNRSVFRRRDFQFDVFGKIGRGTNHRDHERKTAAVRRSAGALRGQTLEDAWKRIVHQLQTAAHRSHQISLEFGREPRVKKQKNAGNDFGNAWKRGSKERINGAVVLYQAFVRVNRI